eukprot:TRINITY_DN3130_c0_g1_i1.p1 TRINITY_DN3130_c0_g1~~TRINITY_DN3130_c0_g1_i1.p1  ORF type:complete len:336 (+),score=130.27 TRINITY_DN3130_c0_g1_i1:90-1097(+)
MKPIMAPPRRCATSLLARSRLPPAAAAAAPAAWQPCTAAADGSLQACPPMPVFHLDAQIRHLAFGMWRGPQQQPALWSSQAFAWRDAATVCLTKPAMPDPDRPKRPATSWLLFLNDFRKDKKDANPKEVMTMAAAKWKTMSDAEKAPFVGPADAARGRYRQAMDMYISSGKKEAWRRDPEKPKRPANAFFLYAANFREENKGMKMTEQVKQAKVEWDRLTDAQKAPYVKKAEAAKVSYTKDIEHYKTSGKELAWQTKVGITAALRKQHEKEEKAKAKKLEAAKKKKAQAAKAKEKEKKAKAADKTKALKAAKSKAEKTTAEAKKKTTAKEKVLKK